MAFDDTAEHLRALFTANEPIIGICAAGILIRCLAPLLNDKRGEPPVIAIAEDGSAVVPLLGGHHGGNELARRAGDALGVPAAVTTAGDVVHGLALDDPPPGWRVGNPEAAKAVVAALLAEEGVGLVVEAAKDDCEWLRSLSLTHSPQTGSGDIQELSPFPLQGAEGQGEGVSGTQRILATDRAAAPSDDTLVLHPATVAIGVGCERGTDPAELRELVMRCLADAGVAPQSVAGIFSIALKAAEPAIHDLAEHLDAPARFFSADALLAETPRLSEKSEIVFRETGCWGVAEGAALAAAGDDAALILSKQRSARATCAIARSPRIIHAGDIGRARGRLFVVGIGPGDAAARTAEAEDAIRASTDLVGYRLYLDLLGPLAAGKTRHDFDLGAEEARVAHALDLAAQGRNVALISSGDAGIYAMGSLVFELIDRGARPEWARVEIACAPGVSAMQTAAARLGAPLGHDFCAISLSDLLTPWPVIEQRLRAAAAGDFVVAFYNPVSQRRRTQLASARSILLAARSGETPVAIARNLGRDGESVMITTLAALDPDQVDMLSLVLVGSSATRRVSRPDGGEWLYTPRGYERKYESRPLTLTLSPQAGRGDNQISMSPRPPEGGEGQGEGVGDAGEKLKRQSPA
ncbi:MAG TPA: precorrin-3B C(17)-methyltransferase [Verrucomicrobiae bacterium]|nr:precorrin-3B C(17)-methyltransferase [Verrucomicrobiae bacterium]